MRSVLLAVAACVPAVMAQQPAYAQCGGIGWSGATSCVSGYKCTVGNPYYSQCLPGSASGSSSSSASHSTSSASGSSSSSASHSTSSASASSSSSAAHSTSSVKSSSPTTASAPKTSAASATVTAAASGNPFSGVQLWANPYYASEVSVSALPSLTGAMATKAAAAAKVPSFTWLDAMAKVPTVGIYLADIETLNKAGASPPYASQFVVYDLPDRDCAALASNGEYSIADNGVANYKAYIDAIKAQLVQYPDVKTILVIEPDSLANLVTNLNVPKCANAESAYKECIEYAISTLNLPNVAMYLDAGHAGWLGWAANIQPAATLFASIWQAAGSPSQVRGLATNVANYNAWSVTTCASYTQGDANCDEQKYINALAPLLTAAGFPAHFITDTSRNGVQPTAQLAWGDWCNVKGTGFGVRPTTNTGNSLEDAFVWVKPGGECDGTSNSSSPRYDAHCGYADALQPAPEAGTWFEAYFEQLVTNANPSL